MTARAVIAIDGSAGSGKSTVAQAVADALGLEVLDTGAMYRAATLAALRAGVDLDDEAAVARAVHDADLAMGDSLGLVRLGGRDVTAEIRGPAVTAAVSTVSAHPSVRAVMVKEQRDWADRHRGGVVEGRDIGTVVFPDAAVKVFLSATDDERARRRQRDETAAARDADLSAVREALTKRDAMDSARATSPLRPAADAIEVDTTSRGVDEVVAEIVERYRETLGAA